MMACCGLPAGCGMLVAGGFCYGRLVDESSIARESQNSPDSLWGRVFNLLPPTGSSASGAGGETLVVEPSSEATAESTKKAGFGRQ